jgi:HEAT repeat protein
VLRAMRDPTVKVGRDVLPALAVLPPGEAVEIILALLSDEKAETRDSVVKEVMAAGGDLVRLLFETGLRKGGPAAAVLERHLDDLPNEVALPVLQSLGKTKDTSMHERLVKLAAATEEKEPVPYIKPALASGDQAVRGLAAEVLARHHDPAGKDVLLAQLKTPDEAVKVRTLEALAGIPSPDVLEVAKNTMLSPHSSGKVLAASYGVFAAAHDESMTVLKHVTSRLKDTDVEKRAAAVYYLGVLKGARALPELYDLLRDGNPEVRRGSARSMGDLGQSESIPHLAAALDDPDPRVRLDVMKALAKIHDAAIVPIVQFKAFDPDPELRGVAIKALADVRHQSAVETLRSVLLEDPEPENRLTALGAIQTVSPGEAQEVFHRAFLWLPQGALKDFAKRFGRDFIPVLADALKSPRAEVRTEAVDAVSLIPDRDLDILQGELASTRYEDVKVAVLSKLSQTHGAQAAPLVQLYATDKALAVRKAALDLAGQTGDLTAKDLLKSALLDVDEPARVSAAISLLRLFPGVETKK